MDGEESGSSDIDSQDMDSPVQEKSYRVRSNTPDARTSASASSLLGMLDDAEAQDRKTEVSLISHMNTPGSFRGSAYNESPFRDFTPSRVTGSRASNFINQVKFKMGKLQKDLKDSEDIARALKKKVDEQKQEYEKKVAELSNEWKQKFLNQKEKFKSSTSKHIEVSNKIIKEKQELTSKLAQVSEQLKLGSERYQAQLQRQHEQHQAELKRHRESWLASEKIRRENWIKSKTKDIREATVRGLEPQLEQLILKNKTEVSALQEKHREAMRVLREELRSQKDSEVQQIKNAIGREHNLSLDEERSRWSSRIQELTSTFEQQLRVQDDRHKNEVLQQRLKLNQESEDKTKALKELAEQAQAEVALLQRSMDTKLAAETNSLKEASVAERENLMLENQERLSELDKELRKRFEKKLIQKEEEIRAEMDEEARKELAEVIMKLESDLSAQEKRLQRKAKRDHQALEQARLDEVGRLNDEIASLKRKADSALNARGELGSEIDDLKQEVKGYKEKLAASQANMKKQENEFNLYRAELEDAKTVYADSTKKDMHRLEQVARQAEHERDVARAELGRLVEKTSQELEQVKEAHSEELAALHSRIAKAIARKDTIINDLTEQIAEVEERMHETERLLVEQAGDINP